MNLVDVTKMKEEMAQWTWGRLPPEIVLRCWEDPEFLAELKASPREALGKAGVALDAAMEFRVVENSHTVVHLVIPACPEELRELDPQTLTPDKW